MLASIALIQQFQFCNVQEAAAHDAIHIAHHFSSNTVPHRRLFPPARTGRENARSAGICAVPAAFSMATSPVWHCRCFPAVTRVRAGGWPMACVETRAGKSPADMGAWREIPMSSISACCCRWAMRWRVGTRACLPPSLPLAISNQSPYIVGGHHRRTV